MLRIPRSVPMRVSVAELELIRYKKWDSQNYFQKVWKLFFTLYNDYTATLYLYKL